MRRESSEGAGEGPGANLYLSSYADAPNKGSFQSQVGFEVPVIEASKALTTLIAKYGSLEMLAQKLFQEIGFVRGDCIEMAAFSVPPQLVSLAAIKLGFTGSGDTLHTRLLKGLFTKSSVLDALKSFQELRISALQGKSDGQQSVCYRNNSATDCYNVPKSVRELDFIDDEFKLLFGWVIPRIRRAGDCVFQSLIVRYHKLESPADRLRNLFIINVLRHSSLSKAAAIDPYLSSNGIPLKTYVKLLNTILAPQNSAIAPNEEALRFVHWVFLERESLVWNDKNSSVVKNIDFINALAATDYGFADLLHSVWTCSYLSMKSKGRLTNDFFDLFPCVKFTETVLALINKLHSAKFGEVGLSSIWLAILAKRYPADKELDRYLDALNEDLKKRFFEWLSTCMDRFLQAADINVGLLGKSEESLELILDDFVCVTFCSKQVRLVVASLHNIELLVRLLLEAKSRDARLYSLGILANLAQEQEAREHITAKMPLLKVLEYVKWDSSDLLFRAFAAEFLAGMTKLPAFCQLMLANRCSGYHVILATLTVLRHSSEANNVETVKFLEKSVKNIKKASSLSSQSILRRGAEDDDNRPVVETKSSV